MTLMEELEQSLNGGLPKGEIRGDMVSPVSRKNECAMKFEYRDGNLYGGQIGTMSYREHANMYSHIIAGGLGLDEDERDALRICILGILSSKSKGERYEED
jgi:hypothetical protein